jgi:hypothetical protein
MSNFVIEIKPSPEFLEVLIALVSAFQPKSVQPVSTSVTAPASATPAPVTSPQQFNIPQSPSTPNPQYPPPSASAMQQFIPPRQAMPVQQPYPQQPPVYSVPQQTPPLPQLPPLQTGAPTTSAPGFTYDDLACAASALADAGKRQEVCNLIAKFGVQALTQLPKEQYGAFATALRQMGAQI